MKYLVIGIERVSYTKKETGELKNGFRVYLGRMKPECRGAVPCKNGFYLSVKKAAELDLTAVQAGSVAEVAFNEFGGLDSLVAEKSSVED